MLAGAYAFVDLETTGCNPVYDRITEIAIVSVRDGAVTERWQQLLDPGMSIPEAIQSLTGITNAMVAGQPAFEDVADEVQRRLDGVTFVAHNARFDHGFLRNALKRCNLTLRGPVLCTVKLSRRLFPQHAAPQPRRDHCAPRPHVCGAPPRAGRCRGHVAVRGAGRGVGRRGSRAACRHADAAPLAAGAAVVGGARCDPRHARRLSLLRRARHAAVRGQERQAALARAGAFRRRPQQPPRDADGAADRARGVAGVGGRARRAAARGAAGEGSRAGLQPPAAPPRHAGLDPLERRGRRHPGDRRRRRHRRGTGSSISTACFARRRRRRRRCWGSPTNTGCACASPGWKSRRRGRAFATRWASAAAPVPGTSRCSRTRRGSPRRWRSSSW